MWEYLQRLSATSHLLPLKITTTGFSVNEQPFYFFRLFAGSSSALSHGRFLQTRSGRSGSHLVPMTHNCSSEACNCFSFNNTDILLKKSNAYLCCNNKHIKLTNTQVCFLLSAASFHIQHTHLRGFQGSFSSTVSFWHFSVASSQHHMCFKLG